MERRAIIGAAVTRSNLKEYYKNFTKDRQQYLVTPTSRTTNAMVLKFFADTNLLSKIYQFE